jgi:hypothetical protein
MIKKLIEMFEKCFFDLKYGKGNWKKWGKKWGKVGHCG